jgi:hypothetical protein
MNLNIFKNISHAVLWIMALLLITFAAIAFDEDGSQVSELNSGTSIAALAPTVTAVAPLAYTTGVPVNTKIITAAFSMAMDPVTLSNANFSLTCAGGIPIAGEVTYLAAGSVATLTLPDTVSLPHNSLCTATVIGMSNHAMENIGIETEFDLKTDTGKIQDTGESWEGEADHANGVRDIAGIPLASSFTWSFNTGVTPDTIHPRVELAVPVSTAAAAPAAIVLLADPIVGVPANTAITVVFTKDMAPATINASSFTVTCAVPCISPAGIVSYVVGSRIAVFMPTAVLTPDTTYTVTITTTATDLAGNSLAGNQAPFPEISNYLQTFVTALPVPPANTLVLLTRPAAAALGVCPSATINVTFNVPSGLRMDPLTLNTATFIVTEPAPATTFVTAASVVLDVATGTIASFTPLNALIPGASYTAMIRGGGLGVKDLAIPANAMTTDLSWSFTAGPATAGCLAPVALGSASLFGIFGGSAGMTNSGTQTAINGAIGTIATATSSITGFHDTAGDVYTQTPLNIGTVNGTIYTCTNSSSGPTAAGSNAVSCAIANQSRADAQAAFLALAALPAGPDPGAGNLANLVLPPGVYTAAAASFMIQGGNLTLDAQGDANAVWVFQMASTLLLGGPGVAFPQSVILVNGAQAKNIYWQVGSAATINAGGGGTMVGTIISPAGTAFSTAGNATPTTLNGRVLSLGASITMVNTVINVPAP